MEGTAFVIEQLGQNLARMQAELVARDQKIAELLARLDEVDPTPST